MLNHFEPLVIQKEREHMQLDKMQNFYSKIEIFFFYICLPLCSFFCNFCSNEFGNNIWKDSIYSVLFAFLCIFFLGIENIKLQWCFFNVLRHKHSAVKGTNC